MKINPVLKKDLKGIMRDPGTSRLMVIYPGLLAASLGLYVLVRCGVGNVSTLSPSVVLGAYAVISIVQFLMLLAVAAGLTAGSIQRERDNNALDLLLSTGFPTVSLVAGKVGMVLIHMVLLFAASLPVYAVVFLFRGIGVADLLLLLLFFLLSSLLSASVAMLISTFTDHYRINCLSSYAVCTILFAGSSILAGKWLFALIDADGAYSQITKVIPWILFANPVYGFGSVIDSNSVPFSGGVVNCMGESAFPFLFGLEIKPWMACSLFYSIASAIFLTIAAVRLRPVRKKTFIGRLLGRRDKVTGTGNDTMERKVGSEI